uniref:Uncharacterized protein n=2 Tax=Opuntia streptacantha TaxID=393608 RepID=A0A7C9DJX0_OPUST
MSLPAAAFRCNSFHLLQSHYTFQYVLSFHPLIAAPTFNYRRKFGPYPLRLLRVSRLGDSRKLDVVCRAGETETEPEDNEDKEKEGHESGEKTSFAGSNVHNDLPLNQEELVSTKVLNSDADTVANSNESEIDGQATMQDPENVEVASGSPLPGLKPQLLDESVRIPKETIDILRDQVFGYDTFFVTGQEPYEGGLLFKGNLRGVPDRTYEKISKRMEDRFGDQYKLFLLINPEDDKPVAVVVPRRTLQPETTAVPEWFAAGAFGLVTVFTLLLHQASIILTSS